MYKAQEINSTSTIRGWTEEAKEKQEEGKEESEEEIQAAKAA